MRDTPLDAAKDDDAGAAFRWVVNPPAGAPAHPAPAAAGDGTVDDDFLVLTHESVQPVPLALGPAFAPLTGFALFISRAAATNIMRHGAKGLQTEHEVAGGLVGRPGYDPVTGLRYTRISAALAVHGHADQYEVEIPPEEWFRLSNLVRDEEPYQASILVGWYHSHPTFDAYLSELDQQTQRQFFGEPWNVAIVVGPQRRQIKAFHSGNSTPCSLYLDPEETDGRLIEVTYEVSAGGVSTNAGVEWVDPPETELPAAPALDNNDVTFASAAPAGAYPDPDREPPTYSAAAAGASAFAPPLPARWGISPLVVGLLVLVVVLLLVLIGLMLISLLQPHY